MTTVTEEINFVFNHASLGNMADSIVVHRGQVNRPMPVLEALKASLEADGYQLVEKPIDIDKNHRLTTTRGKVVSFNVISVFEFTKGDGSLVFTIKSAEYPTIDEAINAAKIGSYKLWYNGQPLTGGKGQLTKCKEIALRLMAEHGKHLAPNTHIYVQYETRGGRGGWAHKIADRHWTVEQLIEESAPKPKSIKARLTGVEYLSDFWNKWRQDKDRVYELLPNGKVKDKWREYDIQESDYLYLMKDGKKIMRFPITEWNRLRSKAKVNAQA